MLDIEIAKTDMRSENWHPILSFTRRSSHATPFGQFIP
jgi:hypothetical protein